MITNACNLYSKQGRSDYFSSRTPWDFRMQTSEWKTASQWCNLRSLKRGCTLWLLAIEIMKETGRKMTKNISTAHKRIWLFKQKFRGTKSNSPMRKLRLGKVLLRNALLVQELRDLQSSWISKYTRNRLASSTVVPVWKSSCDASAWILVIGGLNPHQATIWWW